MPQNPPSSSMWVALGSVIYMIGGDADGLSASCMYYLDTSNPESECLEGPSLNLGRRIGSAVVHDGKIYVFGGFYGFRLCSECFSEVYDPVLNSWEPLSDSPERLHWLQCNLRGTYGDRKFLVHLVVSDALYAYDIVDKSWEVLDHQFGYWFCDGVVMDDVLYLFEYARGGICGYDSAQLKWLKPIDVESLQGFSRTQNSKGMFQAFFDTKEGIHIYSKTVTIKKIIQEDGDVVLEAQV